MLRASSFAALGLLLTLVAQSASAQPPASPLPVTKMTVIARSAPAQALRYSLFPESKDLTPGNAITSYYRAFSPEWWGPIQRDKEFGAKQERWRTMPLAELKTSDASWIEGLKSLQEVDRGARRSYADWELRDRLRQEGFSLLLPDLQSMRTYAALLQIRFRLELADKEYDKAIYTLQTGFSLAKHCGEGPTMIHALVGIAIASIVLGQVEELMQQPDAPNMYWALTALPRGIVDIRHAVQGESVGTVDVFPDLKQLEREVMSPEKAQATIARIVGKARLWNVGADEGGLAQILRAHPVQIERLWNVGADEGGLAPGMESFVVGGWIALAYPLAKERLLASGMPEKTFLSMPATQAVMIDTMREFNGLRDNLFRAFYLPYHEGLPVMKRSEADVKRLTERSKQNVVLRLLSMLLPAVQKVYEASVRPERKVCALRTIEAIRMHAAAHRGKLPARLDEVTIVPIPVDPVTNDRFFYTVEGDTFALTASPPMGDQPNQGNSLRYEVTLKK